MCTAPVTVFNRLPNGQYQAVETACHECWQCRENAINDWVGRNIAESKTATWSRAITLTYGRNALNEVLHERAVLLTYSDPQKYIKLLRRHGFPVRYFITGEYGSKNGRAHWHVMLYGQDKMPRHELDTNFTHYRIDPHTGEIAKDQNGRDATFWPHGWSFWTNPTHAAVRYNCKYIQKDMGDDERQGHMSMSKKPPIGAQYFAELARRYVAQGLAPQILQYSWPDVIRRKQTGGHEIVQFRLKDRSAELFLDAYIAARELYGGGHKPVSRLVEMYERHGKIIQSDEAMERLTETVREEDWNRDAFEQRIARAARSAVASNRTAQRQRQNWLDAQIYWQSFAEKGIEIEPQRQVVEQYEYERSEYEKRNPVAEYRDYSA